MIPIKIAEEINSLAELSSAGLELDLITAPSVRGKLDTGPFCNYDCEFCYYGDQLDVKILY
jgi:hypothetical protein